MKKIKTHWYIEIPFSRLGIYYADNLKNRPYCRRNCIVNSNVWWITKDNLPRKTTLLDYSVVQSLPCVRSRHASFAKRKRTEAIDNWTARVDCFVLFGASWWRDDDFYRPIMLRIYFANFNEWLREREQMYQKHAWIIPVLVEVISCLSLFTLLLSTFSHRYSL